MSLSRTLIGERGKAAESEACRYLTEHGLRLLERNYRCRHGEIDLIMNDGNTLVFVEVRYRSNRRYAGSAESIDRRKRTKLTASALHFLQTHPRMTACPARFDVVAIHSKLGEDYFEWIRNAFGVDA